jgi:hypothetical protein
VMVFFLVMVVVALSDAISSTMLTYVDLYPVTLYRLSI